MDGSVEVGLKFEKQIIGIKSWSLLVGSLIRQPIEKNLLEIGSFFQFSLPPTKLDATKESPMPV